MCFVSGRTHQLRVHCKEMGYPIVGDFIYSDKTDTKPYRMMLHAFYFKMPTVMEIVEVKALDPFTTEVDPLWKVAESVRTYDVWKDNFEKLN